MSLMSSDQLIRRTLWASAAFNIGGASLFAFPASALGQLSGLPPYPPPIYRFLLALLVFGFGCAYVWLALQQSISRPFICFVAIDKTCVFLVVLVLWILGESPPSSVIVISGDLILAALFALWLLGAQPGAPADAAASRRPPRSLPLVRRG